MGTQLEFKKKRKKEGRKGGRGEEGKKEGRNEITIIKP